MTSLEGHISVTKALRFREFQHGEHVEQIVYALHGYGQLAEFFIRKFIQEPLKNTLIVAPEGMHRFYLQGSSGRVGASWMTKEWREQDIQENIDALNELFAHFITLHPKARVIVLGFSQGGATASRWVAAGQISCSHFISWASVFPPDLDSDVMRNLKMSRSFCLGNEDPYFNEEDAEKTIDFYRNLSFDVHTYIGKHDIEPSLLAKLLQHE